MRDWIELLAYAFSMLAWMTGFILAMFAWKRGDLQLATLYMGVAILGRLGCLPERKS